MAPSFDADETDIFNLDQDHAIEKPFIMKSKEIKKQSEIKHKQIESKINTID